MTDLLAQRAAVIREAESWLLTPFHHGAAVKGPGVDCARLVAAVYQATGIVPTHDVGEYAPEWFQHEDEEKLLAHVTTECVPVESPQSGDLALFQFGRATAHVAFVTEWPTIIHADRQHGAVCRSIIDAGGPMARRFVGWYSPRVWHPAEMPRGERAHERMVFGSPER